jgi:adenine-specific DNA-methyltransferase
MASKRKILEALTRTGLLDIARHYEITGLTGHSKADIVDALAGSRKVQTEEFLNLFGRDNLKGICQSLGLNESGREKQVLMDRIMGREADTEEPQATANDTRQTMAKKRPKTDLDGLDVEDYRHSGAKRTNIPPAKIAAEGTVPAMPKIEYSYSPRRPPVLRFDPTGKADQLPELLEKATKGPLTKDEAQILAEALRTQQPWLEWAGKQEVESKGFTVDPVALHIHERISAQAILKVATRQDVERTLFSDPEQDYHEAVQFYKHDIDWTNRLVLGDSAQVMASLAHREDMAGRVQMLYMDPPYGIKYPSNFQPEIGRRDVKDKDSDLTRELEMVKAYRDTWHLGVHSYIHYLRERLIVARDLLSETGSIFIQISDENIHRVRQLLDELFGVENFVAQINYRSMTPMRQSRMASVYDYVLWYARAADKMFFQPIYTPTDITDDGEYSYVAGPGGAARKLTRIEKAEWADKKGIFKRSDLSSSGYTVSCTFPFQFQGQECPPKGGKSWRTTPTGMERAIKAERLFLLGKSPYARQYNGDFGHRHLENSWHDTAAGFSDRKVYVVQTHEKIIQRCMMMTTKPGDLVLDPTCGSGTTAVVAEQWGRRWITIDSSRVAVALARQRLLTQQYEYYDLKDIKVGIAGGLRYRTLPRIELGRDVGQNSNLDPIFVKHEPILNARLRSCNDALTKVTAEIRQKLDFNLIDKQRNEGKRAITDSDKRRWELPKKGEGFEHWTLPFDTDPDWPKELQQAVTEYLKAWRIKMQEVNDCIAANAAQEELVDQPEVARGVVRVSGPFSVEAVQPPERSLGAMEGMFDGGPEELEDSFETKNVESYLDQMTRLLKLDGVRFPNNKELAFSRLERLVGQSGGLHAEGRWLPKGEADGDPEGKANVAVGFGPQYGPITAKQVEDLIRSASRRGYDALVVAGFSFDGPAQAAIEEAQHPKLHIHMAHIRPDINPGMSGLLKDQKGSQLFTVFGQPRTRLEGPNKRGDYIVHMEGVDIYDPVANTIRSTEDSKVAAWFVDGDYDGRTFCITQAFFPDKSAWDKLANALGGVVSDDAFEKLSGTVSLPFPAGKHKCVAVKVIDPRGNEVMQVHRIG